MTVTNSEIGAYVDSLSDVGTPASGDELLIYDVSATTTKKVQASALVGIGGSMATDSLWDAKGDLALGTGANTGAKLTAGANGKVPTYASGETTGMIPAYPPGYEFDYAAITAGVTITGTSEGSETTVITGNSVAYDGSTAVWIEFFAPAADLNMGATGRALIVVLYEDSTILGRIATRIPNVASVNERLPITGRVRRTPSNASHTYTVKAYKSNAGDTVSVGAGAGGTGANVAAYLRVTKV